MIYNPVTSGKKLPELTSPGVAADLARGKELIGEDGEVVTGKLIDFGTDHVEKITDTYPLQDTLDGVPNIKFQVGHSNGDLNANPGEVWRYPYTIEMCSELANFGNATAADVAAGKTFTSAAGVNVTGTGQAAGQIVNFGFLISSPLVDEVWISSDALCAQYGSGGLQIAAGDQSAHTLPCSLNSIVVVEFMGDNDNIPVSGVSGFERITVMSGDRGGKLYVFLCTSTSASLVVNG